MRKLLVSAACLLIGVTWFLPASAQDFGGTYAFEDEDGPVALLLSEDASGRIAGQLDDDGEMFRVEGGRDASGISGLLVSDFTGERFGFVAKLQDQNRRLWFKAFPLDDENAYDDENSVTLVFARQSTTATTDLVERDGRSLDDDAWHDNAQNNKSVRPGDVETDSNLAQSTQAERDVWINRARLPVQTVQAFETQFGTQLPDGRYWYDVLSGGWGIEGGPTAGFMLPGLNLPGPMPVDISGGGTRIYINGREIHPQDQMALHQIFGVTYEGRYWLDSQGNIGVEGGQAIGNLLQASRAAGGQGGVTGTADGAGGMSGVTGDGGAVFMKRLPSGKMLSWSN